MAALFFSAMVSVLDIFKQMTVTNTTRRSRLRPLSSVQWTQRVVTARKRPRRAEGVRALGCIRGCAHLKPALKIAALQWDAPHILGLAEPHIHILAGGEEGVYDDDTEHRDRVKDVLAIVGAVSMANASLNSQRRSLMP